MRTITSAFIFLMIAAPAMAADLPVPLRAKQERVTPVQPLTEFDRLPDDCIEATNGCQRYVRASDGKYDAANNIGIACQPKALSCTKRK